VFIMTNWGVVKPDGPGGTPKRKYEEGKPGETDLPPMHFVSLVALFFRFFATCLLLGRSYCRRRET